MYKGIIGIITALAGKFQLLFTVNYRDNSTEKGYDKITVSISNQALKSFLFFPDRKICQLCHEMVYNNIIEELP